MEEGGNGGLGVESEEIEGADWHSGVSMDGWGGFLLGEMEYEKVMSLV